MKNLKSLSLVLSGGGARGLAHIGVLKVLQEFKIPISSIGGCSMGGLIASLWALGIPVDEIEKIARKYSSMREMVKLVDLTPHRKGIIISQRLKGFLSRFIDEDKNIEDSKIPLFMNAVNLFSGEEIVLDSGNLLDAIIATTAIPGFFSPLEKDGVMLADGGIVDNLPISIMKKRTDQPIVAIDVHHTISDFSSLRTILNPYPLSVFPGFVREYYLAELIKIRKLTDLQLIQDSPDLLLHPRIDPHINIFFSFEKVDELIASGEQVAKENSDRLLELIA